MGRLEEPMSSTHQSRLAVCKSLGLTGLRTSMRGNLLQGMQRNLIEEGEYLEWRERVSSGLEAHSSRSCSV